MCLESTVVLVDMASSVSKVEWLGVKVEGVAKWLELTVEGLVETDDVTNWSASWIGTDSSRVPSYKVPAGLLPTEVETEGAACSESAKLTSSWVHAIAGRMVVLDEEHELVHVVQCDCAQAPVIESGQNLPCLDKLEMTH